MRVEKQRKPRRVQAEYSGVILAGGLSRRMDGQAKVLMPLAGQPIPAHAIRRIAPNLHSERIDNSA